MHHAVTSDLLPFVKTLAEESAGVVRRYFRAGFQVEQKQDASPVTVADREAELRMRDLITRTFPDHGILGEEFPPHQPGARYQWVLDPIDGTKNFVAGGYIFGTLIALVEDGQPILGAVNHPLVGELFVGDNHHAWRNDEPIAVRACAAVEDALLLTTEHWSVWRYQNGDAFDLLTRRVREYRGWGGCHGYALVAGGGADIMLDPNMHPWDLLPMIPLIRGAGGAITDWQGSDPVQGNSIVATGGAIHDEVIRLLNP